jgi:hypothetical protein
MDARGFGRPVVCKKCGGSYTIGWGKDPKGRPAPIAVGLARKSATATLQVSCSCGYRRAVTAAEAAGHNRCPGCGRSMIVVKPPPAKGPDGKVVSLPPPPDQTGGSEPRLVRIDPGTQTVDCVCGERILVRAESIGQTLTCKGCSRRIKVELRGKSSSTYPRVFLGGQHPTPPPGLTCECGQFLEIAKALDAKGTVCTKCGRTITMEKVRSPQTKHTIVRPRFSRSAPIQPASSPTPPSERALQLPPVEFTEEVVAPSPAPARPEVGTQAVFCPCGEALMVGAESIGRNVQCPTCLTLIAVDQVRDGNSGNYVLRVRAIGKMDNDTWSLNDFS